MKRLILQFRSNRSLRLIAGGWAIGGLAIFVLWAGAVRIFWKQSPADVLFRFLIEGSDENMAAHTAAVLFILWSLAAFTRICRFLR